MASLSRLSREGVSTAKSDDFGDHVYYLLIKCFLLRKYHIRFTKFMVVSQPPARPDT